MSTEYQPRPSTLRGSLAQWARALDKFAQDAPAFRALLRAFVQMAGVLAMVGGSLVLLGWLFDLAPLKSAVVGYATMKPLTALSFILCGLSLWLLCRRQLTRQALGIAQGCALLAGATGLLTLSAYLLGWNLGIDELLFPQR